jgi:hypothetical protein
MRVYMKKLSWGAGILAFVCFISAAGSLFWGSVKHSAINLHASKQHLKLEDMRNHGPPSHHSVQSSHHSSTVNTFELL